MVQKRSLDGSDSAELKAARLETQGPNSCSTQPSSKDPEKGHDASIASATPKSRAAKFNTRTLKKLQAAVDKNREVDLTTQMPLNYSVRLVRFQEEPPIGKPNGRASDLHRADRFPEQRSPNQSKLKSVTAFELRIPLT